MTMGRVVAGARRRCCLLLLFVADRERVLLERVDGEESTSPLLASRRRGLRGPGADRISDARAEGTGSGREGREGDDGQQLVACSSGRCVQRVRGAGRGEESSGMEWVNESAWLDLKQTIRRAGRRAAQRSGGRRRGTVVGNSGRAEFGGGK